MGTHSGLIEDFKKYAEEMYLKNCDDLINKFKTEQLPSNHLRLKAFNEQLNALRHILNEKIQDMLSNIETEVADRLKKDLIVINTQYINKFYRHDFYKE